MDPNGTPTPAPTPPNNDNVDTPPAPSATPAAPTPDATPAPAPVAPAPPAEGGLKSPTVEGDKPAGKSKKPILIIVGAVIVLAVVAYLLMQLL